MLSLHMYNTARSVYLIPHSVVAGNTLWACGLQTYVIVQN